MNIGNKIVKAIIIVGVFVVIIIIASYINHRFKLKKEEELFKPLGDIVEVNGNNMSIYTEGNGKDTLVFMSGGGTSSPILDFRSLYSKLSADYKIVVIEKLGYGFSDVVDEDRNIDNILNESREALSKIGIKGPYILCPHSMSGIEAIYWAQQYPEEIKAIIGLDMAVPKAYDNYKINMTLLKTVSLAAKIGLTRLIPAVSESDAIKYGTLNEEEKEINKAIFYRRTATKTMINEAKEIKNNAIKVKEGINIDIPILMFCSNGKGTGWSEEQWEKLQKDFIADKKEGNLINLECSHYVHNHEYKKIEEDMKVFIDEINY